MYNLKVESKPLLDNDVYNSREFSVHSSSTIYYSTDYGTYPIDEKDEDDSKTIVESESHQYSSANSGYYFKSQNYRLDGPRRYNTRSNIESSSDRYSLENDENNFKYQDNYSDLKNVVVSWDGINCYAPILGKNFCGMTKETGTFKQILFEMCGIVRSGNLTAIIGGNGAGKSTLLNIIMCRNLGNLRIDGEVKVNGCAMNSNIKSISAYVQQSDVLCGRLKVREHLLYNAALRMGSKYSKKAQTRRVNQLITEMGLDLVENDFINSSSYKFQGLGGSEKKLLSIACEMLTDPPIVFLDEPTTGLDSKMAYKVIKTLESLAKKGKCIVCTIHQPSSHIFEMFNEIYLCSEGRLIFQGNRDRALVFFYDIGFPCTENYNPVDHYINTMAIKPGCETDCRTRIKYMVRKFKGSPEYAFLRQELLYINLDFNEKESQNIPNLLKNISPFKASYWQEIKIQVWKQLLNQVRDPKLFAARYLQNFILMVVLVIFHFRQTYNQAGVNNIDGVIFSVLTDVTFLPVIQLNSFVMELKSFFHEHNNGMIRSGTFFISQNISEIPIFLSTTLTTALIIYWSVGLYPGTYEFLMFIVIILITYQYSCSLNVWVFGTIFRRLDIIITLAMFIRLLMMYLGGFYVKDVSISPYINWLKYLSCQRYGFEILMVNQWQNVKDIKCESTSQDACYKTGEGVINFHNFSNSNIVFNLYMLVALTILFRLLGLVIILLKSKERKLN